MNPARFSLAQLCDRVLRAVHTVAALLLLPAVLALLGTDVSAQVDSGLAGRVLVADTTMEAGTVVLHLVTELSLVDVDSTRIGPDGSFSFGLPEGLDSDSDQTYIASVRHQGVMYFGGPVDASLTPDSLYEIQAYDTLLAPVGGVPVALQVRSVIVEPSGSEWAVTDVFQLRNDRDHTVVPREGGRVWSYPLPVGARDVAAESEMSGDVVGHERGDVVFRAALPPGERLFVLRYFLDSLEVMLPTPGETETLEVLLREPAPSINVEGLTQNQSVQLGEGTYRVFSGQNIAVPQLRVVIVEEAGHPPVEWIAVLLTLVLAGGGLVALRGRASFRPAPAPGGGRRAILVQLAQLDEEFERSGSTSESAKRRYRQRRDALMGRLRVSD